MTAALNRAVFLDRDGVLNRPVIREGKPHPPDSIEHLEILPGVHESLLKLRQAGFLLLVVTNQPDVGRGIQSQHIVEAFHSRLKLELALDDILICYHTDSDHCDCRKPLPGLLLQASKRYNVNLPKSYMIGDRWRDIDAGHNAGCQPILINYKYDERSPQRAPAAVVDSLSEATDWILSGLEDDPMSSFSDFKVKLFGDGADKATMTQLYKNPRIQGFTTNPTLMRKAGVTEYERFARDILELIPDRSISFEVFADDFSEMERQALKIASWGENVYVKIPVTNTRGEPSADLISRLTNAGVKINVTALLTLNQVRSVAETLKGGAPAYISVFAGRIADTGRDPVPIMQEAVRAISRDSNIELIWASPRELLNVFQADAIGCHIITATSDILKKLDLIGKDLDEYSLETVKMFYEDARQSAFAL